MLPAGWPPWCAAVTESGRFVAFVAPAEHVSDESDCNYDFRYVCWEIYLRDRSTQMTYLLSRNDAGERGNYSSEVPYVSADGRFAAFESIASDLVEQDTNDCSQLFFPYPSCPDVFLVQIDLPTAAPTMTPSPTPVQAIMGDADCDGDADLHDVTLMLREIGGTEEGGCNQPAGLLGDPRDVNCDSVLTTLDPLDVLLHLAGLPELPLPSGCPAVGEPIAG